MANQWHIFLKQPALGILLPTTRAPPFELLLLSPALYNTNVSGTAQQLKPKINNTLQAANQLGPGMLWMDRRLLFLIAQVSPGPAECKHLTTAGL